MDNDPLILTFEPADGSSRIRWDHADLVVRALEQIIDDVTYTVFTTALQASWARLIVTADPDRGSIRFKLGLELELDDRGPPETGEPSLKSTQLARRLRDTAAMGSFLLALLTFSMDRLMPKPQATVNPTDELEVEASGAAAKFAPKIYLGRLKSALGSINCKSVTVCWRNVGPIDLMKLPHPGGASVSSDLVSGRRTGDPIRVIYEGNKRWAYYFTLEGEREPVLIIDDHAPELNQREVIRVAPLEDPDLWAEVGQAALLHGPYYLAIRQAE